MNLSTIDPTKIIKSQSLKSPKKMTLQRLTLAKTPALGKTCILADISGSMWGTPLGELKKALKTVWKPGFSGIAFNSDVYSFSESDISTLPAEGGTCLLPPLQEAWNMSPVHIILMTDGQPSEHESDILEEVSLHKTPPIDTIGLGTFNKHLLQEIARLTKGKFMDVLDPHLLTQTFQFLLEAPTTKGGSIQL
jgi:hypothetical protein